MQHTSSYKKEKANIGLIGVGLKGVRHLKILLSFKDVEVKAIAEIDEHNITEAKEVLSEAGYTDCHIYSEGETAYRELLERKDIDGVIISTPWGLNTTIAIEAMKAGKYVGIEVPAAQTIEDCWNLIKSYEETGSPIMILENACYLRDVMAILNMVREGLFGELVHCQTGYQHDLRNIIFDGPSGVEFGQDTRGEAKWRTEHVLNRNADLYPTHGVGPLSMYLDINSGNKFDTITSFSTKSLGIHKYITDRVGEDHPNSKIRFKQGDVVTTIITTTNGETITLTYDTNLPRPYSLGFRVQGTNGIWMVDNNSVHFEGVSPEHEWEKADLYLEKYDHKLWKEHGEKALDMLDDKARDYFVLIDFIEAIKKQSNTPLDVYDAATWSAITPLSEESIRKGSLSLEFPDFTKGKWAIRKPVFGL